MVFLPIVIPRLVLVDLSLRSCATASKICHVSECVFIRLYSYEQAGSLALKNIKRRASLKKCTLQILKFMTRILLVLITGILLVLTRLVLITGFEFQLERNLLKKNCLFTTVEAETLFKVQIDGGRFLHIVLSRLLFHL